MGEGREYFEACGTMGYRLRTVWFRGTAFFEFMETCSTGVCL